MSDVRHPQLPPRLVAVHVEATGAATRRARAARATATVLEHSSSTPRIRRAVEAADTAVAAAEEAHRLASALLGDEPKAQMELYSTTGRDVRATPVGERA